MNSQVRRPASLARRGLYRGGRFVSNTSLARRPPAAAVSRAPDATFKNRRAPVARRDVFSEFVEGIKKLPQQPELIVLVVVALLAAFSPHKFRSGITSLKSNTSTLALGQWLENFSEHLIGVIILLPGLYKFPTSSRHLAFLLVFVIVVLVPAQNATVYAIASFCLVMYWQVPRSEFRTVLLVAAAAYFYLLFVQEPALGDSDNPEVTTRSQ